MLEVAQATDPARAADLALLRRYEPVVRYTVGEEFFPTDVERYLAGCSLWVHHPDGRNELLLEAGRVTTETLAGPRRAEFGAIYHLNLVEPRNIAELTAFLVSEGVKRLREDVRAARRERAEAAALLEAIRLRHERLERGEPDDPRAHIRRLAAPAGGPALRFRQVVEVWAAVCIGLLLVGLVFLLVSARQYLVLGLAGLLGAFVAIEAIFQRRLVRLISALTVGLAVVSALVLLYEFFWQIAVLGVLLAGLYLLWENLRELTG